MNTRKVGKEKEELAKNYLINNGYNILDTNYYTRFGEIDIVAKDNDTICFIEVKYRKDNLRGFSVEAIDLRKQKNIISVAKHYIISKKLNPDDKYRFDVVSIDNENITLYKGAFS